jgi:hypothetical protein
MEAAKAQKLGFRAKGIKEPCENRCATTEWETLSRTVVLTSILLVVAGE